MRETNANAARYQHHWVGLDFAALPFLAHCSSRAHLRSATPDCEVAARTLTRLRSNVNHLRTTTSVGLHLRSLPNCAH